MRTRMNPWLRRGAFLPGLLVLPFVLERGDGVAVGLEVSEVEREVSAPGTGIAPEASGLAPAHSGFAPAPTPAFEAPAEPVRASGDRAAFSPSPAPYTVEVNGAEMRFEVQAVSVLAGDDLIVEAPAGVELLDRAGLVPAEAAGRWIWTAPAEAGVVPLRLEGSRGRIDLNVLVMRPMDEVQEGMLNGYPIGRYVRNPNPSNPTHEPPVGFVEVLPADEDVLVSPHFTLGQFLCKEPGDPRYMVLTDPLLVKLEAILAAVNEEGYSSPTLHVMSGFRTPAYNRAIGNTTDLSRHLWGDAADIFIDNTGDGMMDDLNGDGRVDDEDARILMRIVERVEREDPTVQPGGLSLYRTIPGRGPFIHVDARGTPARW